MAPFLVLVCGGRDYMDRDRVFSVLDRILRDKVNVTVLHGACYSGADRFADEWATEREIPCIRVPARWSVLGKVAGPERNGRMLCYLPNGVVAFPGGSGTQNMVDQAKAAGVKVWEVI
jgi:hypothetical protein